VDKVLPLQWPGYSVARDDGIDVLDRGYSLLDCVGISDTASAIAYIDQRLSLGREHVSGMHCPQRTEYYKCLTIGVRGPEIIEVDFVRSAEQGHLVFERPVRKTVLICRILEDVHLFHVRLCVLMRHDINAGRKELIAAGVVAVCMRIDDRRDGLITYS